MDANGPNAEQITYWNDRSGPKWVAEQARLDGMIAPFGARVMDALALRSGEHVIDVGCGCGGTSLELGRRVTPRGGVLGVDISEPMLARARERAAAEHLAHVRFVAADAQTHGFEAKAADAIFSRFGVMFFADPSAAFANLHAALRPGGRLAFVCWQPISENPWLLVPVMAAAGVVPLKPPPPPDAPGPFSFGDRDRVSGILASAGFHEVAFEAFSPDIVVAGGGGVDEVVQFMLQMGPLSAVLDETGPDDLARVAAAVREAVVPYEVARGVAMPSAAWIVTARG
jgi:SAM-dependent methyltransferase